MEGNPADLTVYRDSDVTHDHTYIGNGCPGGDGSTPCETRIVKTADNENQKNGTYYTFQAATDGTGGPIATDNDTPDTFCPLGWQLPYSGKGGDYDDKSKTWNHLFKSYGLHIGDGTATDATKVKSYPFSYVYSGYYSWNTGRLYYQSNAGNYWSSSVVSSTNAYLLHTWSSVVKPANEYTKAGGLTVRCFDYYSTIIDGTVEGNPADLTVYADDAINHNHTYYGNGCPGYQDNGATTPCSTRLVDTSDGETQKNGTYYHFQAATSGSGAATDVNNANSPDTFCPLGWQLPYGGSDGDYYDKSKSGKYLLVQYGAWENIDGMKFLKYPLSFIYAGGYNWENGTLNNFGSGGYYITSTINAWRAMYRISTASFKYVTDPKYYGNPLRCD